MKSSNFYIGFLQYLKFEFLVQLWPQFNTWRRPKSKIASGYPNKSKSRPYILSIFNENYNNFLLYLVFFRIQIGPVLNIKRSQLRLAQLFQKLLIKGCVRYIFTTFFCMSKREHLWNEEKNFLFHFQSSFCSWDNQILTFQIFKFHDIIKYLSMKQETHFTK